jgi:hypothetical protein
MAPVNARTRLPWLFVFLLVSVLSVAGTLQSNGASASSTSLFVSSKPLLLKQSLLPAHYRLKKISVVYSVQDWDGGIKPVMTIDENNGWLEASQEDALDPRHHAVLLSVQLFRTVGGARQDFGQFFTNEHPETIYVPGSTWLGGSSLPGLGDQATVYRISDDSSRCPQHLTSGVSFVYRNGIFSVSVCTATVGERSAVNLAGRLLARAELVH